MTTPTQEQVEAAVKAYHASTKSSYPENAMKAALTAAARVGEPNQKHLASYIRTIGKSIEDRTIERCARVVDKMVDDLEALPQDQINRVLIDALRQAAGAIRKLKDDAA